MIIRTVLSHLIAHDLSVVAVGPIVKAFWACWYHAFYSRVFCFLVPSQINSFVIIQLVNWHDEADRY
jgi:hypothetical protein